VAKLRALGLAAERIHSGRDRAASRQTCRDYLDGRLDFLFIAPERLAVPGFPELLARRPPALVAVDEAHCISHWGHDFRPDYRLLGERLPQLRPAPVIALTATATPRVQEDIADQLHLDAAQRFIHGFRRDNLAVEVAELPRPQRPEAVARVLADPARRPAIVYAPSRRDTEELAARLARDFPAAAYHAGMEAARRERVQQAFLAGELSAIVATIAFGMGVDKPDVRTIVHTGLPGSLEGYYQEIGRAGRDGRPARAILLHSYADLRLHEHFHARNYPDPEVLQGVYEALGEGPRERAELAAAVGLDEATLEQALDRLRVHGGVRVEADGRLIRGEAGWREAYRAQREHHLAQLDAVSRFAEAAQCRMLRLVQHFGDREDHGRPCGLCDVCAPRDCLVAAFQPPDATQRGLAEGALAALRRRDGQTVGQLHKAVGEPGPQGRRGLQRVLEALARAGWVVMEDDAFDKDGETIRFQRVHLAERAPARTEELADLPVPSPPSPAPRAAGGKPRQRARSAPPDTAPADPSLVQALKAWRLEESRRRGLRAFQVFGDRTLLAIAAARPRDRESLLSVPGMGPTLLERYGQQVLDVIRNTPTVMSGA
jgi:DNA topoisomerase-3